MRGQTWLLAAAISVASLLALGVAGHSQPPSKTDSKPPPKPAEKGKDGDPAKPDSPAGAKDAAKPAEGPPNLETDENYKKAVELIKQGKVADSLEALKEMVKLKPEYPPAKLIMAKFLGDARQTAQSRLMLEQAAAESPDHPDVYISMGNMALSDGRVTDAMLHFERAAELGKTGKWPDFQKRNIHLACTVGLATVAEARGQWQKAADLIKKLVDAEPKNGRLRFRYGRALFMVDKREEAANEFEQAAADDKNVEPAGIAMGRLFSSKGNKEKAREWMDYAVKKEPKNLAARVGFAAWLVDEGQWEEAQTHVDAAASIDEKSVDVMYLKGLLARRQKDYTKAEREFERLIQQAPTNFQGAIQLALVLVEQDEGKQQRALELAQRIVQQLQRNPEALATYSWILYKQKRIDDAEKAMELGRSTGQISADAAYYYSHILADRGKLDDVRNLLKSATAAQGRFFFRKEAEAWLKQLEDKP
jgi:tetratricopeptide (TPR) repeat protein